LNTIVLLLFSEKFMIPVRHNEQDVIGAKKIETVTITTQDLRTYFKSKSRPVLSYWQGSLL